MTYQGVLMLGSGVGEQEQETSSEYHANPDGVGPDPTHEKKKTL